MRKVLLGVGLAIVVLQSAVAQKAAPVQGYWMDRYEGNSVQTFLGAGVTLNKDSTLVREFYVLSDPSAPLKVSGRNGVSVQYDAGSRGIGGEYIYRSNYTLEALEPVQAFEVRAQVFDVFGRHLRTLSATQVVDLTDARTFVATWRIWSEAEAASAYASIMYVASVRTKAGRVYNIDSKAVLDQARKVAFKITEAELEPPKAAAPTR